MAAPLLGFVVALPNEWKYFCEAFTQLERGECNGLTQYRGRFGELECVIILGGAGRENAATAARTLLEHHEIAALLSLGYAGGLSPELARGDIVLCAYSATRTQPDVAPWELELEQNLRGFAGHAQSCQVHVGPFFTAETIVARPNEKRRILQETGAKIVDMESAALFNIAREECIPFLGIRSITDMADDEIPALEVITPFLASHSFWRYPKIFWDIVTHPKYAFELATLSKHASLAGKNLAEFMKQNQTPLCNLIRSSIDSYPRSSAEVKQP